MLPSDNDDLTPGERAALDALPRETTPSRMLEERTVQVLRREGMLRARPGLHAPGRVGWLAAGLAAALALFAGGVAVGQWLGTRSTVEALVAVERANAMEVASLVQQTGSQYAAALAALSEVPSSAENSGWVAQGREAAIAALYNAADQMVQVAPDDPLVAQILQALETEPDVSDPDTPVRQVAWF